MPRKEFKTLYLIQGAMIAAMYAILTLIFQPISYGMIQVRISEALTILPAFTPAAIPGLFLGCLIANLFNPTPSLFDIVFGSGATLIAAALSYLLRGRKWIVPLPPVIINALVVGWILNVTAGLQFITAALWVGAGELIACYILGMPLYYAVSNIWKKKTRSKIDNVFTDILNFIKREKLLTITFGIFILALLANQIAGAINPWIVERVYSSFIFKYLNIVWSSITGLIPLSIGEMLIIAAIPLFFVFLAISVVKTIKNARTGTKPVFRPCFRFLSLLAVIFFITVSAFIFSWSINYSREPFAVSAGYKVVDHPVADLVRLCENLAAKANKASELTSADTNDAMVLKYPKSSYFARSAAGFTAIEKRFPTLAGHFGRPKPVLFSLAMCYAGTTGIYFPLTGEANINYLNLQPDFLYTISHEMAHQRGFAREDEANFISYLACVNNPDDDIRYAGYYSALFFSMNTLYGYSPDDYNRINATLSARIKADLSATNDFWKQFEGPVQEISNQVNDTYLKANKIYDGVYSYGRVVDLLLAEQSENEI